MTAENGEGKSYEEFCSEQLEQVAKFRRCCGHLEAAIRTNANRRRRQKRSDSMDLERVAEAERQNILAATEEMERFFSMLLSYYEQNRDRMLEAEEICDMRREDERGRKRLRSPVSREP